MSPLPKETRVKKPLLSLTIEPAEIDKDCGYFAVIDDAEEELQQAAIDFFETVIKKVNQHHIDSERMKTGER